MADQADVRRIALSLPGAIEGQDRFAFSVANRGQQKGFTEPHYRGFPAILVRLGNVGFDELEELIVDAWRGQAPKALVQQLDRSR